MQIKVTALDPTTGAVVSGVVVSNVSIDVDPETATTEPTIQKVQPNFFPGAY